MLDHLFETYGNITAVDLEINFEHMRRAWDPQQPVESLFKKIQDCAHYYESGGVIIGHPQQNNVGYAKIFATGHFMSACRRWNEKHAIEKTWTQFKSHFQLLTVNTSKCRENPMPHLVTTRKMPPFVNMMTIWLKLPLALWQIWPQQPQRMTCRGGNFK
jgi:hypothetical protein